MQSEGAHTLAAPRDELMDLPHGWRWGRLGDVIVEAQPGFASGERSEDGIIQLRMNNVDTRGHLVWDRFIRVPADPALVEKYSLRPGDVVFNNTNSTELVGKSALVTDLHERVVFSNHFTRLRSMADVLEPAYLAYWLLGEWQSGVFSRICNQWIGQSAVKNDKLLDLLIPLPPLADQRRISTILRGRMAAVDRARAAAEAQLAAARALPAAYLRAVFESDEAREWDCKPLGQVGVIGSGITLGRALGTMPTRSIPYLRVANVKDGRLDLSDVYETKATEAEISRCGLEWGDLLLTEGGDPDKLGRGTHWQAQLPECIHQNHIFRVRFDLRAFSPAFVAAQIGSSYGKAYFLRHAKQTTGIATINQQVLAAFPLMTPSSAVQARIAGILAEKAAETEYMTTALRAQLDAINQLSAALLWHAFSGEM